MSALDLDATRDAYVQQIGLLADLVESADLTRPVPTCPEWTLQQLARHVGRGDRWAAAMVAERAETFLDPREVPDGTPPPGPGGLTGWLRGGAQLLLESVDGVGADAPVWTFVGPRPAGWWVRRRLHESTVHRADAALALGVPYEVAPEVAADGISEWLDLLTSRPAAQSGRPRPLEVGSTLHLHATDGSLGEAGEWMIRGTDDGLAWEHGHGKGSAAVRGPATALLLATFNRIPADDERLQVLGDSDVLTTWLERTRF